MTTINDRVIEIYKENSNFLKIGTIEQYSQYLKTIFPNSKIKDIVYSCKKSISGFDGVFYNTDSFKFAKLFSTPGNITTNILNVKNYGKSHSINRNTLKVDNNTDAIIAQEDFSKSYLFNLIKKGYGYNKIKNIEQIILTSRIYIVFNKEQIYTLGGKQDFVGFEKYLLEQQ